MKRLSILLRLLGISSVVLVLFLSFSSGDQLNQLIDRFERYNQAFYEKIYVHTNKEIYSPADYIWFSAYITGVNNEPSASNILYLTLLDTADKEIMIDRYPIINGRAGGVFLLPDSFPEGDYTLFAYTKRSIINKSSFLKTIKISSQLALVNNDSLFRRTVKTKNSSGALGDTNLKVSVYEDSLKVQLANQTKQPLHFLASLNGTFVWASEESAADTIKFVIPTEDLNIGNLQVAAINSSDELIASYNVFINGKYKPTLKFYTDKETYEPGEKVRLKIIVDNPRKNGCRASLSISVTSMSFNSVEQNSNIFTYMYNQFSSEYDNNIYWKNRLYVNDLRQCQPDTNYYNISGRIYDETGGMANKKIVAVESTGQTFFETESDRHGYFKFHIDTVYQYSKFVVGPQYGKKGVSPHIQLFPEKVEYELVEGVNGTQLKLEQPAPGFSEDYKMLKEVLITDKKVGYKDHHMLLSMYNNVAVDRKKGEDLSYMAEGNDIATGFISVLRQVTLVSRVYAGGRVLLRGNNPGGGGSFPVLFVLNGIPIGHNYHDLDKVNGSTIEEIVVIRGISAAMQYGTRATGGAVIVTTKDDVMPDFVKNKRRLKKANRYVETSYLQESLNPLKADVLPDTLSEAPLNICSYWSGNLTTDEKGEITVEYFNSHLRGKMMIKVEGVDEHGNFISGESIYQLE